MDGEERPSSKPQRPPKRPGGDRSRPARRRRRHVPWWATAITVVAVVLLANAAAAVIGPNIPRQSGTEERAYVKADQIYGRSGPTDVAIFGSSETAGGLIPDEIESQAPALDGVYNAALPGSSLGLMEDWADRVVDPQLHPKIAIIGMLPISVIAVDPEIDPSGGSQAALDAYESAIDQINSGTFGPLSWTLRQRSALIRYRPLLRSPSATWAGIKATVTGDEPDDGSGPGKMDFRTETNPLRVKENTAPDGEILDDRDQSIPLDTDPIAGALYRKFAEYPTDLDSLESFVDSLRSQGITPVIAIGPVDRTVLEASDADLPHFDAIADEVQAWGEANGVPVHSSFGETWDPALFHDRNHLAEAGARRWSQEVGTWLDGLCEQGDISDC